MRCAGAQHPSTGELDYTTFATSPKSLAPPLPQRLLKPPAWHRSLSSTHVLFSGFLATSLSVISGISSENAGGELISGWLSGAAVKRQPPQALFALGA